VEAPWLPRAGLPRTLLLHLSGTLRHKRALWLLLLGLLLGLLPWLLLPGAAWVCRW
jgi:hypothetical protein